MCGVIVYIVVVVNVNVVGDCVVGVNDIAVIVVSDVARLW